MNVYDLRVTYPTGAILSKLAVSRSYGSARGDWLDTLDGFRDDPAPVTVELLRNGEVIARGVAGCGEMETERM